MSTQDSFIRKLLPIYATSIPTSIKRAINDFGFVNFIKIVFFVSWRIIKYKFKLSLLPKQDFIEKDILGNKMLLNRAGEGISWDLLVNGIREENSTYFFREELKPGMNVLEVGANIGYYLLQESTLVGDKGHIFSFEPDPNNNVLLEKNIALNNVTNITHYKKALGDQIGLTNFFLSERGNLSSFAIPSDTAISVEMCRGDDLFAEKRINYVRMDVEGYEFNVLRGIQKLLQTSVQGLFIEIHPFYLKDMNTSMADLTTWLESFGFYLAKAFSDHDWNNISFDDKNDLLRYKYSEKMVWRCFFRKRDKISK